MVMSSAEIGTKNVCADEDQQEFPRQADQTDTYPKT
jgi:hypothetical protein